MKPLTSTSLLSGIATHIFLFRHGEWDLSSPQICLSYLFLITTTTILDTTRYGDHLRIFSTTTNPSSLGSYSYMLFMHLVGITLSIVVYRVLFHRLKKFPGPWWARVSNFYMLRLCITTTTPLFKFHEQLADLHAMYGDFLRLGPNQLFIADPKAVRAIHASSSSKTTKGPGYAVLEPRISLSAIRDPSVYTARRHVWDKAFQPASLRDYESRIQKYTDQLTSVLKRHADTSLQVNQWFNFFAFDVMGDLSFGKSFDMLLDGREAYLLKNIAEDRTTIGLFSFVPWTFPIFIKTPGVNTEYLKMWRWIREQVRRRESFEPVSPDIFSWILQDFAHQDGDSRQLRLNLDGDAYLLVIAGSETTSITLTSIFFHLAHDPVIASTVRNEILALDGEVTFETLRGCRYLNAVINETLRLHPVILSGLQRKTPPEGLMVGSTFVPGDVLLQVSQFVVNKDERCFVRASEFIPERWTTRPDLVVDSSGFIPFSTGVHSCVGKQLALMEMRWVVARILLQFTVRLADDQSAESFSSGTQDFFTALPAPLSLVFSERGEH